MKNLLTVKILVFTLLLWKFSSAQAQTPYRFEAETAAGMLQVPSSDRNGWAVRQQLTAYVGPRVGVSVGLTWGGSANTTPLDAKVARNSFGRPDPVQLTNFYVRDERMVDLSVVFLPVLTRRHQLAVRAGVSAHRSNATRVDSTVFYRPNTGDYQTVLSQTSTSRVMPMLGASYDYRLTNRWAVGAFGTAHVAGAAQPTTTYGLRTTYRFNLGTDSLGMNAIDRSELRAGIRLAGNLTAVNGRSSASVYRFRGAGGLWVELPLSLTWQIRGEINYAQRGYESRELRLGSSRYLPTFGNLNYLELPLLFRNEVAYRWHLYWGPYLAFFLNGRAESDGQARPTQSHTISGLMLGADYRLTDQLALDARYQRDLIRLSSTPYGGLHGFQLGLTYAFRTKR